MATLTLDKSQIPEEDRAHTDRYIRELWREMRVLLARQFGKSIDFIAVLEFQANGRAHLHILVGVYIPQKWLSQAWQSIGGGRIVDIRYVDVHRVSAYLSAYLTGDKVQHTLELLPKRARIFSTSRSIKLWDKKKQAGWWLRREDSSGLWVMSPCPSNARFDAVEDLKPFGLEMLSYFESPPFDLLFGNRKFATVLEVCERAWAEKGFRLHSSEGS